VLPLLGCSEKNQEKCDEALRVARQSLAIENTPLARQWRERAYRYCDAASGLQSLDAEIVKRDQEIQQRKAADATRQAEATQVMTLFVDWAAKSRATPDKAVANISCRGPEDSKERWCEGQRKIGDKYAVSVLYWEQEPEAAQFKTRVPHGFDCAALGEHRLIKSFNVEATKRSLCEITGGPLAGMKAVVSAVPAESEARVFTDKYLQRDAGLKAQLGQ
jgi:hypothetical protein